MTKERVKELKNHFRFFLTRHLVEGLPVTEKDLGSNRVRAGEELRGTHLPYAN